jgi:predicted GNAT family N-acyltransferase
MARFSEFELLNIDQEKSISGFDCGDRDLNEFLLKNAMNFHKEKLATTYLLKYKETVVAFFSIFNDGAKVGEIEFETKGALKRFLSNLLPHPKRHLKSLPAIKIGRLGVSIQMQSQGIGEYIVRYILNLAMTQNNNCACRLLLVDAYEKSLRFYEKLGFKYFSEADIGKVTRQMYLDLDVFSQGLKKHI